MDWVGEGEWEQWHKQAQRRQIRPHLQVGEGASVKVGLGSGVKDTAGQREGVVDGWELGVRERGGLDHGIRVRLHRERGTAGGGGEG